MLDSDASTAKDLTLVAIILQVIFFAIGIFATLSLLAFSVASSVSSTSTGNITVTSSIFGGSLIAVIFSVGLAIGILWILLDYFLIYKKLKEERIKEAETPALILGIIQLIFGGLIPGILLIVAWVKIKDSVNRHGSTSGGTPPM